MEHRGSPAARGLGILGLVAVLAGCENAATRAGSDAAPAASVPLRDAPFAQEDEDEVVTYGDVSVAMRIVELCAIDPPDDARRPAGGYASSSRADDRALFAEVADCLEDGRLAGRRLRVLQRRPQTREPGLGSERQVELRLLAP